MKNIFRCFCVLILWTAQVQAGLTNPVGGLKRADEFFDKGEYQTALDEYSKYAGVRSEEALKAFYRSSECEGLLYRYGEAATRMAGIDKLPVNNIWRARLMLLRAEMGRQFLAQYGYSLPQDLQAGTTDVFKFTKKQWEANITADYAALWPLRNELSKLALGKEGYFINLEDSEYDDMPTFWQFTVSRRASWLLEIETQPNADLPTAESFVVENYKSVYSSTAETAEKVAVLYEDAAARNPDFPEAAAWKIKRLLIPFTTYNKTKTSAINELRKQAAAILSKWAKTLPGVNIRANAAYEAAAQLNLLGEYNGAVELCRMAESIAPKSRNAKLSERLRAQIEMPTLSLRARFAPPGDTKFLGVTARNLEAVYFRLYKTSPHELSTLGKYKDNAWGKLRYFQKETIEHFLPTKAEYSWSEKIKYSKPYQYAVLDTTAPAVKKGVYLAVVCSEDSCTPGATLIQASVVNITDIFLLGTPAINGDPENFLHKQSDIDNGADANMFNLYAVNAITGEPLAGASIDSFVTSNWSDWTRQSAVTGADGYAGYGRRLSLLYGARNDLTIDPMLTSRGAYAYWSGSQNSSLSIPQPVRLFVETDRPVYRPGQTVQYKVTALVREQGGYRAYSGTNKVRIIFKDQNWQEIEAKNMPLSVYGGAGGAFKIPEGRLLGNYSITAILGYGNTFEGHVAFRVEEYKRPEFEVKMGEAAGALKYGTKTRVSGTAKYYFGSPVPGAKVEYVISRERYLPWYAWWRCFFPGTAKTEIASGKVTANESGEFSFEFTPEPESKDSAQYPSSFEITASARDAGGRTISDTKTYTAGSKAYIIDLSSEEGFFTTGRQALVNARLLDLNSSASAAAGSYALYKINAAPELAESGGEWGSFAREMSLDKAFEKAPDSERVAQGKLQFIKKDATKINFGNIREGVYRLRVKADDPWGGQTDSQRIVVWVNPDKGGKGLNLPPVAIFEKNSYAPGDTARILLGAGAVKGVKYLEILAGNFLLERRLIKGGGVSLAEILVNKTHRGGFGARWLSASDFKIYSAMADAVVPMPDKELSLSLAYPKALKPGQKTIWTLHARDYKGRPVNGEITAKVYDRSLEYYNQAAGFWGTQLYPVRTASGEGRISLFVPNQTSLPVRLGVVKRMMDLFQRAYELDSVKPPAFRVASSLLSRGIFNGKNANSMSIAEDSEGGMVTPATAEVAKDKAMPAAVHEEKQLYYEAKQDETAIAEPARKDFSETAYFNPLLKVVNGTAKIILTMPERLTSWRILSNMITSEAKTGFLTGETVTKKELMARLDIPRFFREHDKSVIVGMVTNESGKDIAGQAELSITAQNEDAAGKFGAKELTKQFSAKKGETIAVTWPVSVPTGSVAYKFKIAARSGNLSDAEERELPVLPSRERLIASVQTALDGAVSKELKLKKLTAKDDTREIEAAHLEIQPQLILTVLNSLPFLVQYPHECAEQLLNRFVPLAITNSFYSRYPALKAAVSKIPKRDRLTPAWERNNPVRQMSLMETPWEEISKGRNSVLPVIDMLNPKLVAQTQAEALEKLKSYQNSDGSFPWFPGGKPDLYITLYILEGMAEAANYNAPVPKELVQKALRYVLSEIPSHMKPEENETATLLYAAYVLTSFPESWPEHKPALAYVKPWVDYADRRANALTAFGKAYAARVYFRLGEKIKAEEYLRRAMDGAREDDVTGVYWSPEKISWLWYNDTVEKHAFILRTLLSVKPKDPKIPGMVKWLLFNRKSGEWKSTKASAAAIYSLLDVMKTQGALDKEDSIKLNWGDTKEEVTLKPYDWMAKPLRWSKYAPKVSQNDITAAVSKTGPGLSYASLTAVYTTNKPAAESPAGILNISRKFFLRAKEGQNYVLKPLSYGDTVENGAEIEVQLTVNAKSRFEYVHLKDPKGAGFESTELLSGWKWDQLSRYEEPRDSLTNFFMDWLPHGEYVLKYRIRPTTKGTYRIGAAVLQSMYAPEFAAHSAGMELTVK